MVLPTVGLDREAVIDEEEVDAVAVDTVVDERTRQAVVVAEGEEEQFEVGAGAPGGGEVWDAVPGELRLPQRAAEEVGLDPGADVLDRAGWGRHRDAVAAGDVLPLRDHRDSPADRGAFPPHRDGKAPQAPGSPPVSARRL